MENYKSSYDSGVGLFKDMNIFQDKEQMRTFCLQIKVTSYQKVQFYLSFFHVSMIINQFIVYPIPYGLHQFLLLHLKGSKFRQGTNTYAPFLKSIVTVHISNLFWTVIKGVSGCIFDYFRMDKDYIWVFKDYKDHILSLSSLYQTIKTKDHRYYHLINKWGYRTFSYIKWFTLHHILMLNK